MLIRSLRLRKRIRKHPVFREDDGTFDEVLQFPDISRPGIGHESLHRSLWYIKNGFSHMSRKNLDKVCHQQLNVVPSLSQRWESDRKNIQTIKKIAAEFVPLNHFR